MIGGRRRFFSRGLQVGEGGGCVARRESWGLTHSNISVPSNEPFLCQSDRDHVLSSADATHSLRGWKARYCIRQHMTVLDSSNFQNFPPMGSKSLSSEISLILLHLLPGAMSLCYLSYTFKRVTTTQLLNLIFSGLSPRSLNHSLYDRFCFIHEFDIFEIQVHI